MSNANPINHPNRISVAIPVNDERQSAQAVSPLLSLSSVKNCSSTIGREFINTDKWMLTKPITDTAATPSVLKLAASFAHERKPMISPVTVDDEIMQMITYIEQSRAAGILFDNNEISDIIGSPVPSNEQQAQETEQREKTEQVLPEEKAKRQRAKLEAQRKRQRDAIGNASKLADRHQKHELPNALPFDLDAPPAKKLLYVEASQGADFEIPPPRLDRDFARSSLYYSPLANRASFSFSAKSSFDELFALLDLPSEIYAETNS